MRSGGLVFGRERAKLGGRHRDEVLEEVVQKVSNEAGPAVFARAPNIAAYEVRRALMRGME